MRPGLLVLTPGTDLAPVDRGDEHRQRAVALPAGFPAAATQAPDAEPLGRRTSAEVFICANSNSRVVSSALAPLGSRKRGYVLVSPSLGLLEH